MTIKELKNREFFTRKPITEPKESQVYIKVGFDRAKNKYECMAFNDISKFIYLKADTEIFTDFTF